MYPVGKAILVVGGYRTGSTLQYNLVGTFLEASGQGRRIGLVDPDDVDTVLARELQNNPGAVVAKCHHLAEGFGNFERPTAWRPYVESGVAIPLSTARDTGAVKRSMSRKFGIPIDQLGESTSWKVNEANVRAWAEFLPFEQSYVELTEQPIAALRSLVHHLGFSWDPTAAASAVEASSAESARRTMAATSSGGWDPISLLHWDHIAPDDDDPAIGASEANAVQER